MTVYFGKATLDVEQSVFNCRLRGRTEESADWEKYRKKAQDRLDAVNEKRDSAKIQALAEQLDDRFTLVYHSDTEEILHDAVEIWLDLPTGTTSDFGRFLISDPKVVKEEDREPGKPLPEKLYESFAAWRDSGALPMVFKPSPMKQWRRALNKAIKLQVELKAEGKL